MTSRRQPAESPTAQADDQLEVALKTYEVVEWMAKQMRVEANGLLTIAELARELRVNRRAAERFAKRHDLILDVEGRKRVVRARLDRVLAGVSQGRSRGASRPGSAGRDKRPRRQTRFVLADE